MRNTERVSNFGKVVLKTVFVLHHGRATDDFEIGDLGQIRPNLIFNPISEVSVLLVIAEILKWEHSDAFLGIDSVRAQQCAVSSAIGRISNGDLIQGEDYDNQ